MKISILGPLSATEDSVSVVPTAAKPRSLLALLATFNEHVVPMDVIIEELWEDMPPRSAATTIQTYVLHLRRLIRRALGPAPSNGPKEILRTEHGGYLLDRSGGSLDVFQYDRLAASGYEAMRAGDYLVAKARMESALALWRGPAFVDVQAGSRLVAEATLLEESRKTVLERRIEADLHLGLHHELVGELAGLTAQNTTDERLHAHHMVALCRVGRRVHALNVFARLRSALADELGLDPSPGLTRLHQAILCADPALEKDAYLISV